MKDFHKLRVVQSVLNWVMGQGHGPRIIGGDVLTLKIQAGIENEGLLGRAKSLLGHIASDLTRFKYFLFLHSTEAKC